jgi:hypothetical protein
MADDLGERRRQRRLAKNRITAAKSRERKKMLWADMEYQLSLMDDDNKRLRSLLQQLAEENQVLRGQLNGMALKDENMAVPVEKGKAEPNVSADESALLVFLALLLLFCSLSGEQSFLLGSSVPLLLIASLGIQSPGSLLRFLVSLKMLLMQTSKKLWASVRKLLFRRHAYLGRKVLYRISWWAGTQFLPWVKEENRQKCSYLANGLAWT